MAGEGERNGRRSRTLSFSSSLEVGDGLKESGTGVGVCEGREELEE